MGTSSSNIGPKGNNPLLPPWAPPPPEEVTINDPLDSPLDTPGDKQLDDESSEKPADPKSANAQVNFTSARRNLTRYVGERNKDNFRRAAKSYVKSYGGGRRASSTAMSGKTSGARFIGFISGIANNGLNETLRNYDLSDCIGKSADFVLNKIADLLAPSGATNEEAATRNAILDTLSQVYENFELESDGIEALSSLDADNVQSIVQEYVCSYIFRRWLHELGIKFEEKAVSTDDLYRAENQAKEYIKEAVKLDFKDRDILQIDFESQEGQMMIDSIFDEAYIIIEQL